MDLIFPPRDEELLVRTLQVSDIEKLLSPTLVQSTTPESVVLLPFKNPYVRALLHENKYFKNKRAAELLAHALQAFLFEYIVDRVELAGLNIYIVPIPLSLRRYKERGYNQVKNVTDIACTACALRQKNILAKIRDTHSQTTLGKKDRLRNQHGAFASERVSIDSTYIIVDDVLTTGATLQEACKTLEKAGAKSILPIALAH